jgi:hypothetical protein
MYLSSDRSEIASARAVAAYARISTIWCAQVDAKWQVTQLLSVFKNTARTSARTSGSRPVRMGKNG